VRQHRQLLVLWWSTAAHTALRGRALPSDDPHTMTVTKLARHPVKCLLIDLDDTLYRNEHIPVQVKALIESEQGANI
jgi:predicted HAD superfamily phosphohydrolase YqeG